jgi:hypothetical protein
MTEAHIELTAKWSFWNSLFVLGFRRPEERDE